MKRRFSLSFPISVVFSIIFYLYFTTVFIFIDVWFGLMTSTGIMNASVFTILAVACVFNYILAIITDPGRVPSGFLPDVEDADNPIHEIKRKGGDLRYCQKCSHYKPPRAHHCRVCKICILRMDHHCIWINNCVGYANYKIFFVFVVYAVIECIYALVMLVGSITIDANKEEGNKHGEGGSSRTTYVLSGLLLVPLSTTLCGLLCWHIHLILQNKTTIEHHEGVRAMWLAEKGGTVYKHPYDLGAYENLTSVLGSSSFCWVCPTLAHIEPGSGLRFRTAFDTKPAPT